MTPLDDFLTHAGPFSDVVAAGGDWSAPSPCAGWSARDVLDHVVDTEREFFERHEAGLGPRPDGEPATVWATHLDAVRAAATPELLAREYDSVFGRTTVAATLASFYGFDLVVHRWDLARGLGGDTTFTEPELDLIEAALPGFGEHLYADGVCAAAVPVPEDASRQVRLLGTMGRDATSTG
ncbi:maleylpyruvate isomerase family mycothiol-dependent enzyme [Nocardioides lianchengensis]|uniref:TIGR03086 family protein n=1 Tax=Nocardioides lianchengensis TaxID=1045774 RepID=A0A1G6ZB92_9ACTN|nr:maleylpyruvate isomerase family mycothiol-dependent enzyme [Nocardioides lianchengensis]NYG11452.1 uncharacterized protein (TIGR03086 family) [Nocardioides lianchengensis]SDD99771.1 TIGR03086 family protein [Nocardioides lianchengensis]